jgi:hypothetical protein
MKLEISTSVADPHLLSCWIRIPYADPDPGEQKVTQKKKLEILCFELLDVLF